MNFVFTQFFTCILILQGASKYNWNFFRFPIASRVIFLKFAPNPVPCYKSFNSNYRLKSQIFRWAYVFPTYVASSLVILFFLTPSQPYLICGSLTSMHSLSVSLQHYSIYIKYTLFALLLTKPSRFRYPVWEQFLDSLTVFHLVHFHIA